MRDRLQHLSALESLNNKDNPSYMQWFDIRLHRWLVDWLLRDGRTEMAKYIAKEKNIEVEYFSFLFEHYRS